MEQILLPQPSRFQWVPPFENEVEFEHFLVDFFNELDKTKTYKLYGRRGQNQFGIDIISNKKQKVIQAKLKSIERNDDFIKKELLNDLEKDFTNFNNARSQKFKDINHFIFATTFKEDTLIDDYCRSQSTSFLYIEYWSWSRIVAVLEDLNDTYNKYFKPLHQSTNKYFKGSSINKAKSKSLIQGNLSLVNQIHNLFENLFFQVQFYPIHLLINLYPIRSEVAKSNYYYNFVLSISDKNLFDFLKANIGIEGKEDNDSSKLISVFKRLSKNLIYYIEGKDSRERFTIEIEPKEVCHCIDCQIDRLLFVSALPLLKDKTKELSIQIKVAYNHYRIGNFVSSANLFLLLAERTLQEKKYIQHFICIRNLTRLRKLFFNNFWGENEQKELLKKLDLINLDDVYFKVREQLSEEEFEIIKFIYNSEFITQHGVEIFKTTKEIKDHYYAQLKGGWVNNRKPWELINEYAQLNMFIGHNFIIYDCFSEYIDLTDTFIEAIFISLIIDSKQRNLNNLTNYLIYVIVHYASPESLLKHINRYSIKNLPYEGTERKEDNLLEKVIHLLTTFKKLKPQLSKYLDKGNDTFNSNYNKYFSNLLILSGVIDFDKKSSNEILIALCQYLDEEDIIIPTNIKYIHFFLNRKSSLFETSSLKKLVLVAIKSEKLLSWGFLIAILNIIDEKEETISLSDTEFNILIKPAFSKISIKGRRYDNINFIPYLYKVLKDDKQKSVIKTKVLTNLKNSFDQELFYLSMIHDIFTPTGRLFNTFISNIRINPNAPTIRKAFTGIDEKRYPALDDLINICFKYSLDLKSPTYSRFKGIDEYYDWLLDMEGYDYSKFDVKWVCHYQTIYYMEAYLKYPIIVEKIESFLSLNKDPQLETFYINLKSKRKRI